MDAHQHFWRLRRGDYGWLTAADHPAIFRDFLPEHLGPLMHEAGVERTVLVQAAPTDAETDFLLGLANGTQFVAGVVGWTDLAAPDAPARIEALGAAEKLVGLRPMLQDLADDEWILGPRLEPAFRAMVDAGLALDALVKPRHLPTLRRFLRRWPELRVVVDHGAKPEIAAGAFDAWAPEIRALARESRAFCKLSGLVTEASGAWTSHDLAPYVGALVEAFGPDRLMWGSDWPVVNEAGGYLAWRSAAEELVAGFDAAALESVFGGAAQAFYGLAL